MSTPPDDVALKEALESAHIPSLAVVLFQLTGDRSLLAKPVSAPVVFGEAASGLSRAEQEGLRARAFEVLRGWRDSRRPLPPPPSPEALAEMMSFCIGVPIPDEYIPMMREEMALEGVDARSIHWESRPPQEVLDAFHVLVIGAGMSGLCAAIKLEEAGIPYTVVEKNETVGGTWLENRYPGCRVDIPNHFYSYSFEPNHDWPEFFSQRDDLQAYFEHCATKYGVRPRIRFGTEVVEARYDEERARWSVQLRSRDGRDEILEVNALVSGVGQLNRPKIPHIPGLESFAGPAFHSARFEHEHDLGGKTIAVVGNGASAMQIVPELAERVERLIIFQRSPQWAMSNPNYQRTVSEGKKWLMKHVPFYAKWYRFSLFWSVGDGLYDALRVDPEWEHPDVSLNAANDAQRVLFTDYIKKQIGDDPELLEKAIPRYPPFGKRMLIDAGWFRTLRRENVELVTDPIREITTNAVLTDGQEHPVDAIIFATGFHANKFLWPMTVVGRSGAKLGEVWGENPRAYLGITVPGFPNLFCLYGPNTNLAHGGSIIFHSECQVHYAMTCLKKLLEKGFSALECRRDVHDAYNQRVDETHSRMVWTHPAMSSWYKNREGRVTTNSPWRLVDYWKMTSTVDPSDYVWTGGGDGLQFLSST